MSNGARAILGPERMREIYNPPPVQEAKLYLRESGHEITRVCGWDKAMGGVAVFAEGEEGLYLTAVCESEVKALRGDRELSDREKAIQLQRRATAIIGEDGKAQR